MVEKAVKERGTTDGDPLPRESCEEKLPILRKESTSSMFPPMADKCESGNVPCQASLREGFKNRPHYRFVTTRGFTPRESVALRLQDETGARADYKLKPMFVDLHDTTPFTCAVSRQVGQRLMKNEDAFNTNDILAQLRSRGYRAYLHQHSTGE